MADLSWGMTRPPVKEEVEKQHRELISLLQAEGAALRRALARATEAESELGSRIARLNRWLVWLTAALVVFTIALVVLTWLLLAAA